VRKINFRSRVSEEPEINLIPFIDVLLVVLIFLMLSTTYGKFSQLKINLPVAGQLAQENKKKTIDVSVTDNGRYFVNGQPIDGSNAAALMTALQPFSQTTINGVNSAEAKQTQEPVLVIHADANARQRMVVAILDAAQRLGLQRITFATQAIAAGSASIKTTDKMQ
jgi:biopolymer transport protein ExbD